jgi:hypothetical protein
MVHFGPERLTIVIINNVQGVNGSAIRKTVTHKIQGPSQVRPPVVYLVFHASSMPNHGKCFEYVCGSSDDPDFAGSPSSFCSPSVTDSLRVAKVPPRSRDHLFSGLDIDRCSNTSSPFDRLVSHSARVHPSRILPTHAALPLLEFFPEGGNILEHCMLQTQVCIHVFQPPILFFQFLQAIQVTG